MVIKGYRYKGWGILRNTERSGSCYQETFFFNSRLGVSLRSRKSSGEILSALKAFSNFTHSSSLDEAVPPLFSWHLNMYVRSSVVLKGIRKGALGFSSGCSWRFLGHFPLPSAKWWWTELCCDSNYQNHARDVPNGRFRMGMVTRRVDEDNANGLEMCGWC